MDVLIGLYMANSSMHDSSFWGLEGENVFITYYNELIISILLCHMACHSCGWLIF